MTLGANQIGAYAADLLDLEDQITALQDSKRDLYASIRDEHGKAEANALKQAVKLSRMDGEKRTERDEIDTEAQRMLAIIEKSRAPRATRESAKTVPVPEIPSIEGVRPETPSLIEVADDANAGGEDVDASDPETISGKPDATSPVVARVTAIEIDDDGKERADAHGFGSDVEPVAPTTAAGNDHLRPYCLHSDDLSKCAGQGRKHCYACLKAHADEEGIAA